MAAVIFNNWPDTLEELAEGFINRLIYTDIKYQYAMRIFSNLYMKKLEKEHPTKVRHMKGDQRWDLEAFLESL